MLDILKVDHIDYSFSKETEKKFLVAAFETTGVLGLPMHLGIFSMCTRMAIQLKIPLVIWGENSQLEYRSRRRGAGRSPALRRSSCQRRCFAYYGLSTNSNNYLRLRNWAATHATSHPPGLQALSPRHQGRRKSSSHTDLQETGSDRGSLTRKADPSRPLGYRSYCRAFA